MLFWPNLGHFWCPVVTLVTFSCNLSLKKKKIKIPNKTQQLSKIREISKNQFYFGKYLYFAERKNPISAESSGESPERYGRRTEILVSNIG